MRIGFGVIGYGRMGSLHAASIAACPGATVVAVCDTDDRALQRAERDLSARVTSNVDDLLEMSVDGVVVASPTATHAAHIRSAAKAGKAVFAEKPVGLTLEEADLVLRDVVDARIPFQIGFQRRWDQRFKAVKDVLDAGDIGEPVLYKAYGRDPGVSSASHRGAHRNGGLFLNCAIHDYDALRFLAGCDVDAISATGAALVHKELADVGDIDTCSTTLFLSSGAMAVTEWSRYATYGYDIGLEVVGTAGVVHMGRGGGPGVVVRRSSTAATSLLDVFGDAYERSIRAFVVAVRDGAHCTPGVEDARAALLLAILARQSYQAGGGVVWIPSAAATSDSATAGAVDRMGSGLRPTVED